MTNWSKMNPAAREAERSRRRGWASIPFTCYRCGWSGQMRAVCHHFSSTSKKAAKRCLYLHTFYLRGFCIEVYETLLNPAVEGVHPNSLSAIFAGAPNISGRKGTMYLYICDVDGISALSYAGWTTNEENRTKQFYKRHPGERRVNLLEDVDEVVGRSVEFVLQSCFDLRLPDAERRIRNSCYEYRSFVMPPYLQECIDHKMLTWPEAHSLLRTEVLLAVKYKLGPSAKLLSSATWKTDAMQANPEDTLSTPTVRKKLKRALRYSKESFEEDVQAVFETIVEKGASLGTLTAHEPMIVTADGRVLQAHTDAERDAIEEVAERIHLRRLWEDSEPWTRDSGHASDGDEGDTDSSDEGDPDSSDEGDPDSSDEGEDERRDE